MKLNKIELLPHVAVWLVIVVTLFHALVWWLAPFHTENPMEGVWGGILIFQGTLISALLVGALLLEKIRFQGGFSWQFELMDSSCRWLLVISVVGLILHLVAKAPLIQSVDMECFSQLRESWINYDHTGEPMWFRASSMLGYLGSHFAMPGLLICTFKIAAGKGDRLTWIYYVAFTLVIMVFAAAIVSRTVVLTALIVSFIGIILGVFSSVDGMKRAPGNGALPMLFFLVLAALFNHFVFKSKIDCGSVGTEENYVSSNLSGSAVRIYGLEKSSALTKALLPTYSYLNHGLYNYAMILNSNQRGDAVLLSFIKAYLGRIGLYSKDDNKNIRIYSRGGATLPGAAYHDFGLLGLILTAVFVAACWVFGCYFLLRGDKTIWIGLALIVGTGLMIAMSFLFVAPATISFPFTINAFLIYQFSHWLSRSSKKC